MAIYSQQRQNSGKTYSYRVRAMLDSAKNRTHPSAAIVERASELVAESGLSKPPFCPRIYAKLRNVERIVESDMRIDGRLLTHPPTFMIELRKDRPFQRKNFTCAHEVAHTFFDLNASASSRARAVAQEPDAMEEVLCNMAAAELLMPKDVITAIGNDYLPRPESLLELASLFGTSLSATAIRLMKLGIWNVAFVMWSIEDGRLLPRWICKRTGMFSHRPQLGILNEKASSIFQTVKNGERTVDREYLQTSSGLWPCNVQSVMVRSRYALTMLGAPQTGKSGSQIRSRPSPPPLANHYDCYCHGTGLILQREMGRTVASRCLAEVHHLTLSRN